MSSFRHNSRHHTLNEKCKGQYRLCVSSEMLLDKFKHLTRLSPQLTNGILTSVKCQIGLSKVTGYQPI